MVVQYCSNSDKYVTTPPTHWKISKSANHHLDNLSNAFLTWLSYYDHNTKCCGMPVKKCILHIFYETIQYQVVLNSPKNCFLAIFLLYLSLCSYTALLQKAGRWEVKTSITRGIHLLTPYQTPSHSLITIPIPPSPLL